MRLKKSENSNHLTEQDFSNWLKDLSGFDSTIVRANGEPWYKGKPQKLYGNVIITNETTAQQIAEFHRQENIKRLAAGVTKYGPVRQGRK